MPSLIQVLDKQLIVFLVPTPKKKKTPHNKTAICLSEIQIEPGILYFCLLNLATYPGKKTKELLLTDIQYPTNENGGFANNMSDSVGHFNSNTCTYVIALCLWLRVQSILLTGLHNPRVWRVAMDW